MIYIPPGRLKWEAISKQVLVHVGGRWYIHSALFLERNVRRLKHSSTFLG